MPEYFFPAHLGIPPAVLGLLDDALHRVDVGVDLPQLLNVRHLLLLQQLQLPPARNKYKCKLMQAL